MADNDGATGRRVLRALAVVIGLMVSAGAARSAEQVAAGYQASFAVDATGRLFAWGSDEYGQLGLGRETYRTVPRALAGQYRTVATSLYYTLAIAADGVLWAWGDNTKGQLGDGTTTASTTPVRVGEGFKAISQDSRTSFGLKNDGTLWGWGDNNYGQMGNRLQPMETRPVLIGSGYASVATDGSCTYAIKTDGALWRWGRCFWHAGDGVSGERVLSPGKVGEGFASVAVGWSHVVAVRRDGSLWSWGHNRSGELGDGTLTARLVPTKVGEGFTKAVAGQGLSSYTLALKADGSLWGWGTNVDGVLASGDVGRVYPTPQRSGIDAVDISCDQNCLALQRDGSLWTWGYNYFGQLGDGTTQNRTVPKPIGTGFSQVSAGTTSAAIRSDGTLWIWGDNRWGQLANSALNQRTVPTLVGTDYTAVATSTDPGFFEFHVHSTLAIRKDGSLWAWGDNSFGQIGDGTRTRRSSPTRVGTGFATVAVSSHHALGVKVDGSLWTWGDNSKGELGNGTTTASAIPVQVGSNFAQVAANLYDSLALSRDGTVWAWGSFLNAAMGDPAVGADQTTPRRVPGLTAIRAIARGGSHAMALRDDGSVWVWGNNSYGQLGDGSLTLQASPIRLAALRNIVAIATSGFTSFALEADGTLWGWGSNTSGQLGLGHLRSARVPIRIGTGFRSISSGGSHTLASRDDGSVRAWGLNGSGRLGDGSLASSPIAVPVLDPSAIGYLSLAGGPLGASVDPLRVLQVVEAGAQEISTRITDSRAAGLQGEVYLTAIVPSNSPLITGASAGPAGPRALSDRAALAEAPAPATMVAGVIARGGFKQTGGQGYVRADSAFAGDLGSSGLLSVVRSTVLENSNAIVCMGVTVPELSAKGQVLMRPLATGSAIQGVVQCPPVQTAATIAQFRVEASGPVTNRTIVALIDPLPADRGRAVQVFAWAVTPTGQQYMLTGPNQWEDMAEPMRPAAAVTLPAAGAYRLEVTKNLRLDHLTGTLLFVGIGDSWEDVRSLNKAGHYYTVQ